MASQANYHIEIWFWRRQGDSVFITRGMNREIHLAVDVLLRKAIRVPILLSISFYFIAVTKLWDINICLCMCKGQIGHANVLDFKTHWLTTYQCDIVLPVSVKSHNYNQIFGRTDLQSSLSDVIQVIDGAVKLQRKLGSMMTVMLHSIMHRTALHTAQTWQTWSRFWKMRMLGHGNHREWAGWGKVRKSG